MATSTAVAFTATRGAPAESVMRTIREKLDGMFGTQVVFDTADAAKEWGVDCPIATARMPNVVKITVEVL